MGPVDIAERVRIAATRRAAFAERLGDGVAILRSNAVTLRNADVDHEFRQDSDFYYLTGFDEPDAVVVIAPAHPEHRFVLFVRPRDREREVWTGERAGVEGAREIYGADLAFPIDRLWEELPRCVMGARTLHYALGIEPAFDQKIVEMFARLRRERRLGKVAPTTLVDTGVILHEIRMRKTPEDLGFMREAARITAGAHVAAMRAARPGLREYDLAALIEYLFRRQGALRTGYATIVGAGANATVLHYVRNTAELCAGDLVLIDAGAEYEYFAADVSRTFPVSGRFTAPQRRLYEIVLAAQKAAIARVLPGRSFGDIHAAAVEVLVDGLLDLGFLGAPRAEILEKELYRPFFMHRTSHWLGMDVHDVGAYRIGEAWRTLEPGMTLTVEPGIYIAADNADVPAEYRGIGIRIEDDLVVAAGAPEVLTAGVPKDVDAIEAIVGSGGGFPEGPPDLLLRAGAGPDI